MRLRWKLDTNVPLFIGTQEHQRSDLLEAIAQDDDTLELMLQMTDQETRQK